MTYPLFPDRLPDRRPHLELRRVEVPMPRRKRLGRPGVRPLHSDQGPALQKQVDAAHFRDLTVTQCSG